MDLNYIKMNDILAKANIEFIVIYPQAKACGNSNSTMKTMLFSYHFFFTKRKVLFIMDILALKFMFFKSR